MDKEKLLREVFTASLDLHLEDAMIRRKRLKKNLEERVRAAQSAGLSEDDIKRAIRQGR